MTDPTKYDEPCVIMAYRSMSSVFGADSAPLRNVPAMPRFYAEKLAKTLNADAGSANVFYGVVSA